MPDWLSDASANRHIKTYVKDFLDLSGNLTVRNAEDYKWNSYGQLLSGPYESNNAQYGVSTDIDASGTTIVVGANVVSTGAYTDNGAVYVYRYDPTAEIWYQLGNTIDSPTTTANTSRFGRNVQISANGNRIAVLNYTQNDLYFYDYNSVSNTWVSAGSILDGDHGLSDVRNDQAIHLSGDGNTIIFGDLAADTNFANSGTTLVYRNSSGTTWTKIGELHGSAENVYSQGGAISYNGNRIYIGEKDYNYDSTGAALADTGRAAIYDYTGTPLSWTQVGDWIYQDVLSGVFGFTGSMSNDGSIVAIHGYPTSGEGNISVYQYNANVDGSWNQLGTTIRGDNNDWGNGVKISHDGTTLVAGHRYYDDTQTDQGALYVYKYINGDWEQQGDIIIGTWNIGGTDILGYTHSYAINGDGTKIVGGGHAADVNSVNSGAVQVFQWSQKAPYSNPMLDISGGTMTVWGGAEENPNNWKVDQIGSTLSGNTNSSFGDDVKLNANGSVMVIGAPGENGMYVYKYRNSIWSQIGSKITHSSYSGQGERVVINDDGTIVSTGTNSNAMNVWEFTNGDWSLKGSTITNGSGTIYFGNRGNAMNGAGNRVVGKSNSFIAAYEYDTNTSNWVQLGSNITDSDYSDTGYTNQLAMNKAGDIIAIGMPGYDQPNTNTGRIAIYKFTGDTSDGSWNQLGNYITHTSSGNNDDEIGTSVSLSDDGYTLAVSTAIFNGIEGRGFVYKYSEIGNRWEQFGPEIKISDVEPDYTYDRFASGISISGDGKTLAISDHNGGETNNIIGRVHVMKYIDGKWTWIGRLDGTDHGDYWGAMCSISRDGTHFAGSNTLFNFNNIGEVKVGKITNPPPIKIDKDGVSLDSLFNADNVTLQCPRLKGVLPDISDYETFWGRNPGTGNWRTSYGTWNSNYLYIDNAYTSSFDLLLTGNFNGGGGTHTRGHDLASRSGGGFNFQHRITAGLTNDYFSLAINARAHIYRLWVGGTAWSNGTYYSSDDRIKHNETPLTNALETIRKLTPRHYIKTLKMYDADHQLDLDASGNPLDASGNPMPVSEYTREDGFIAQEVNEIPELKYTFNESLEEDVPHGLDYTSIFTTAVKALKELDELDGQRQTKLSSLQARIEALENK